MRKWRYELAAPGLGLAGLATVMLLGAAPVLADVTVFATIDKTKDITITETITITKEVDLFTTVLVEPSKFAEADANANQKNIDVEACENCAERTDTLSGSVTGNTGVTTVNQAGGNLNNQGAAVSVAVDNAGSGSTGAPTDPFGFAEAQASADQENVTSNVETINVLLRNAVLTGSVIGNSGITYVNQSVGNINNQLNELSLAFSNKTDGVALSEANLGQINTGSSVAEGGTAFPDSGGGPAGVNKSATIDTGSISGNTGIIGVNQEAGNFGNQANIVSFAAVSPF